MHQKEYNYAQLINEMNQLQISKDQQIKFLKEKLEECQMEMKRRLFIERIFFLGTISFFISLLFILLKCYLFGILFLVVTCSILSYKIIVFSSHMTTNKDGDLQRLNALLNRKTK